MYAGKAIAAAKTEVKRKPFDIEPYFLYSRISPGWQSNALQIDSNVDSRIALALPFFNTEILAIVMPTLPASSVTLIFRFANMTSMLMMIAMVMLLSRFLTSVLQLFVTFFQTRPRQLRPRRK